MFLPFFACRGKGLCLEADTKKSGFDKMRLKSDFIRLFFF